MDEVNLDDIILGLISRLDVAEREWLRTKVNLLLSQQNEAFLDNLLSIIKTIQDYENRDISFKKATDKMEVILSKYDKKGEVK